MRARIRIGEDDKFLIGDKKRIELETQKEKNNSSSTANDENKEATIDTSDRVIALSEYEIVSIQLETIDVLQKNLETSETQPVNKEKGFKITVKGKILSKIDIADQIVLYSKTARSLGFLPKDHEGYKDISNKIKDAVKFKDILEGAAFGLGVLDAMKNITSMGSGESIENCNKLKNWALKYKAALIKPKKEEENQNQENPLPEQEEEKFDDYRNVRIEIVVSELQSLYYELKNMYIESYSESFNIEQGVGTFNLTLQQKYSDGVKDITIIDTENNPIIFSDKVYEGFKILKSTLEATGVNIGGEKRNVKSEN